MTRECEIKPNLLFGVTELVQSDRTDDNHTHNQHLPVGVDAQKNQCVTQNTDDCSADDSAYNRTCATGEGGAADNRSGDGIGFEAGTCGGLTNTQLGCGDDITLLMCYYFDDTIVESEVNTDE